MGKDTSDNLITKSTEYSSFLDDIKIRIKAAQYEALRAVNKKLVALYWDLGRIIVEHLAHDLQREFTGVQGFSAQNLWRMRQFYEAYAGNEKLSPMVREISWSHNLVILSSCGGNLEREFYIRMTKHHGWTKNVLIHQIETKAYERTLSAQTNFDEALPIEVRDRAKLTVKDEYTFSFLSLGDEHEERELEAAILSRV